MVSLLSVAAPAGGHTAGLYDEREQRGLHRSIQRPGAGTVCHRVAPSTSGGLTGTALLSSH